jgi:hypothetical protein
MLGLRRLFARPETRPRRHDAVDLAVGALRLDGDIAVGRSFNDAQHPVTNWLCGV